MTTAVAEVEKMEGDVSSIVEVATQTEILNDEIYVFSGGMLKSIKAKRKAIEGVFGPIKKKSLEAHRENLSQQKKLEDPLIEAEGILKRKMIAWNDAQELLRRKEQARLEAEAKEKEEEARIEEALVAEEAGETLEAEAILSEPVIVTTPIAPKITPKLSGQSFSVTYMAQVISILELVKAVESGNVPMVALKANDVFLNQQARALKEEFSIPGVKLIKHKTMSSR